MKNCEKIYNEDEGCEDSSGVYFELSANRESHKRKNLATTFITFHEIRDLSGLCQTPGVRKVFQIRKGILLLIFNRLSATRVVRQI